MTTVRSGGAVIRYEHAPRPGAPALLLLNSLGASLEMWDDQAQALAERYELIRYDARGHGQSTAGDDPSPSLLDLASDAIAVLDACGVARAHLCGLSLGGMTGMQLAARWPDRVLKVVLANTSAYMPPRENWDARIKTVTEQGMSAIAESVLQRWFTPDFIAQAPERVAPIREMLLNTMPAGYAACSAAIRDMDLRETVRAITATTLVIVGARDPATPPKEGEFIAQAIGDAKVIALDSAHLSNIEQADGFNRAVLEFLAA